MSSEAGPAKVQAELTPEIAAAQYRAQYLQNINQGLALDLRALKSRILLASTAGELFPDAAAHFHTELLAMIQLLEGIRPQ